MTAPDPLALLDALGVSVHRTPTPVTGGADSLIWRVETPDGALALRVQRPEQAPVTAREAQVMGWLSGQGFPVPRVYAHTVFQGRPALLLEWLEGEPLAAALLARPEAAPRLGTAFGELQARLHVLELPPELRGALDPLTLPGLPTPARPALLHLDYHPLNVLVQGEAVSGLIDWTNVRVGDPRADVARSLSILGVDPGAWRLTGRTRAALLAFRRAYRARLPEVPPAFLAWAGAELQRDLTGRHDPAELRPAARWTAWWRSRA